MRDPGLSNQDKPVVEPSHTCSGTTGQSESTEIKSGIQGENEMIRVIFPQLYPGKRQTIPLPSRTKEF